MQKRAIPDRVVDFITSRMGRSDAASLVVVAAAVIVEKFHRKPAVVETPNPWPADPSSSAEVATAVNSFQVEIQNDNIY